MVMSLEPQNYQSSEASQKNGVKFENGGKKIWTIFQVD